MTRPRTTFEHANPILCVADMTRSIAYYVEVLGFSNADWGGDDFTCVAGGRILTSTGSFSGTNSGSSARSATGCSGRGAGPEQVWKFTPPTTRSYTITASGFDTVLYVRSDCDGSELTCNDDDPNGGTDSIVSVSLTAGVPVAIVVDSFDSAGGSYTLGIQ